MLTGDKLETATCIAKSAKLVARTQGIHIFKKVCNRSEAHLELNSFRRKSDCALIITGESLDVSNSQTDCRRFHKTLPNLRLILGLRTSPNPAL